MKTKYNLPVEYDKLSWLEKREVREQYFDEQKGLCYWCFNPLNGPPSEGNLVKKINKNLFPPNFFKHPTHLQHDHLTGLTEGVVHAQCNAVMWQYYGR